MIKGLIQKRPLLFFLICLFAVPTVLMGQRKGSKNNLPSIFSEKETAGTVTVGGEKISYQAAVGLIPLLNKPEEDTLAQMSYTAYFKDDVTNSSDRPITFLFNGGPGSATLWLHMGAFGPKRVVIDSTRHAGGAPYNLMNNDYSMLDVSDLVFVDAPGTGFGRIAKGNLGEFYGTDEDAQAFAQFIERFITKYERWNAPKFLFGESYGTTRSAVLVNALQKRSINMNGVIFLSQILSYTNYIDGTSDDPGNDKPFELALPTYTATAWYHDKLPSKHEDLDVLLKEVQNFALNEYSMALNKGASLKKTEFDQTAEKLHQYTGLPVDYLKKANLRVNGGEFRQELLQEKDLNTGRLDTRFTGFALDPLSQRPSYDPQSSAISGAYVGLFNEYIRKELGYDEEYSYRRRAQNFSRTRWKKKHLKFSGAMNVMGDLANAMKKDPNLQVMLNGGYFDLSTPFFQGKYELEHLPIPLELQKNIEMRFYEAGHMVFLHEPSLKQMHENVIKFIEKSSSK